MSTKPKAHEFELTGGVLCLDFANTLGDRPHCREEHLACYGDLIEWCRQAEALPAREIDRLERLASRQPERARAAFERTLVLREVVFRLFAALARCERPRWRDLGRLNEALRAALPNLEVDGGQEGFGWSWSAPGKHLDSPLWPVARSAAELLTSEEAGALRECASETCSWLFVDRSRTRRRRWCDMSTCGNRAKARRHYRRRKAERERG